MHKDRISGRAEGASAICTAKKRGLLAALCAMLLCSCSPVSRTPEPTTAAPYEDENTAGYEQLTEESAREQQRFSKLETSLFQDELSSARLDLHFLLKNPESRGITQTDAPIAPVSAEALRQTRKDQEDLRSELSSFQTALLTEDQKLTLRILESLMKTEAKSNGLELYSQPLAPTIGTQAQLPMLLCEYTFYTRQDVEDYLNIVEYLDTFYGQILSFEQEKAAAGLMMSDTSLDHVIESCKSYLLVPGNNFMIDSFKERLNTLPDLTDDARKELCARNEAALEEHFVPAYKLLIDGLEKLKGTGTNEKGMCGYPDGKAYYEYLVYTETGTSYHSIDELLDATEQEISDNLKITSKLLSDHPELESMLEDYHYRQTEPSAIMEELKEQTLQDFPQLPECSYTLKDVPKALELSLSPAFYLTSPIDDSSQNVIYINRNPIYDNQPLYNTIAHEGYPGHLYQTVWFHTHCDSDLRKILNFSGYSEGWAAYVEALSYELDNGLDPLLGELLSANSKATLGIHAYLDLAVNYLGWEQDDVQKYLSSYFSDPQSIAGSMFETMVDNPANYLSYFIGSLEIRNMRKTAEMQLGDAFNAKQFHTFLLDMGNAPFDVIQAYFTTWLMNQKMGN